MTLYILPRVPPRGHGAGNCGRARGVANALGLISYLMTGAVSWIYLRYGIEARGGGK